jgi:amidase
VAAIGTETDGSITSPAAANSIVGLKPTVGMVSRSGIIPISHSQDTAGPMARCVEDAAIVMDLISGVDPLDAITAHHGGDFKINLDDLHFAGLNGARIGVPRNYCGYNEQIDQIVEQSISTIKQAGGIVVDGLELQPNEAIRPLEEIVLTTEFKAGLNRYLANTSQTTIRNLADLISFNTKNSEKVMPYFAQELLEISQNCKSLDDPDYLAALTESQRLSRDAGIDKLINEHQLDAIIAPTSGPLWLIDWENGDDGSVADSTCIAAVAGYPSVTVPAGYIAGHPVGLSFFSTANRDLDLLKLAYDFERKTQARIAPTLT